MRNLKNYKKILVTMLMVASLQSLWSLPGIKQYIPDVSGEYVFYRDSSFKTETLVGFLYYNDSTYAARLYSPANAKAKSLEKDIVIYVSVDPDSDHLELTGEKITGTVEGNSDLVNYLHDLLYEFTSRRKNVELGSGELNVVKDDFLQFGGTVYIAYNPLVPVFNIEEICGVDKKPVFKIETAGFLANSGDSSFTDFKGTSILPKDKKRTFKRNKKAEEIEIIGGTQHLTLDSQWKQSMENLWLLGDFALISMNEMPMPDEMKNSPMAFDILLRRFSLGTTQSYSLWSQRRITRNENSIVVMNTFLQSDSNDLTRDFKIITKKQDGNFALVTFTVFDGVYQKNHAYFDSILKSYKVE